jgi:hypothetical protein
LYLLTAAVFSIKSGGKTFFKMSVNIYPILRCPFREALMLMGMALFDATRDLHVTSSMYKQPTAGPER